MKIYMGTRPKDYMGTDPPKFKFQDFYRWFQDNHAAFFEDLIETRGWKDPYNALDRAISEERLKKDDGSIKLHD